MTDNTTFLGRFKRNRAAVCGLLFLSFITLLALTAPLLFKQDPFAIVDQPFLPPFGERLLGTDALGRDIAAGISYGARTSLLIGTIATLFALTLGVIVGALAGYYGRWVDSVLMRVTEFFQTIPAFLFTIVLMAIMSPSIQNIVIAIAVVSWPPVARLVRGEFIRLRGQEFVQAALSLGMPDRTVIVTQILPNAISPVLVTGSLMVATSILVEAALSFLGLGDPNIISWGFMIGAGRSFLNEGWWLCVIPGLAIIFTVLSINMVGDGLNDALNPKLNRL